MVILQEVPYKSAFFWVGHSNIGNIIISVANRKTLQIVEFFRMPVRCMPKFCTLLKA